MNLDDTHLLHAGADTMNLALTLDDTQLVATLVGARCYALQARLDQITTAADDGPEIRHMREYLTRLRTLQKEIGAQIAATAAHDVRKD